MMVLFTASDAREPMSMWQWDEEMEPCSVPALGDKVMFCGSDNELLAMRAVVDERVWNFATEGYDVYIGLAVVGQEEIEDGQVLDGNR